MPTRNRPDFVLQSIKYFHRQNYPHLELIILDDGNQDLSFRLPLDARIRYVLETPGLPIGAKRNRGASLARGSILIHWDDDDWYAPSRVRTQVQPILDGTADLTTLGDCIFFDLSSWKFWKCEPFIFRRMYVAGHHGGTVAYSRRIFEQGIRYPPVSLGEDARFLYCCHQRKFRIHCLMNAGEFLYVRHPGSTWRFDCGTHIDSRGWISISEPEMPEEDRRFLMEASRMAVRAD